MIPLPVLVLSALYITSVVRYSRFPHYDLRIRNITQGKWVTEQLCLSRRRFIKFVPSGGTAVETTVDQDAVGVRYIQIYSNRGHSNLRLLLASRGLARIFQELLGVAKALSGTAM